jgi:hypothetical protein
MEEVQRCKTPEEAREIRRKIFETIERHKTAEQIRHHEDAIESLLKKNSGRPAMPQLARAGPPAPPPPPDLSAITDPEWRETLEKANRVTELLRQDAEKRAAQIAQLAGRIDEAMKALNRMAIAQVHRRASEIYRVPRWFRVQWNLRSIARLAVRFIAIEFLIGEILTKLLKAPGKSLAERLHFSLSEGIITAAVALGFVQGGFQRARDW